MKKSQILAIVVLILALLTAACAVPGLSAAPQAEVPGLADTAAAATVGAVMTQQVVETVMAYLTATPEVAAAEPQTFATATLAPSSTPLTPSPSPTRRPPTSTPLPPTPTVPPCNMARFVGDVTIPDGEIMNSGKEFTKTWRLMNVGSCIWTTDFSVIFTSGDNMGVVNEVKLPKIVLPQEMVNVSINMKTPDEPGAYLGNYQLKTDEGVQFGIGPSATKSFWVRINVIKKGTKPGVVYDLTKDYCSAAWVSVKANPLRCPSAASPEGAVFLVEKPILEGDYADNDPAIVVIPDDDPKGMVMGTFPGVQIRAGNRFKTVVGCYSHSDDCDVTFELIYKTENGAIMPLGTWKQISDRKLTTIDIDLSELAGQKVQLVLKVSNNGNAEEDRAFWLWPRITR